MALASLVPFQGLKKSRFSGPTPSNAPHNDVAPLKIITYRAIKTTGTLIVNTAGFELFTAIWQPRMNQMWRQEAAVRAPQPQAGHEGELLLTDKAGR